jgi:UDP-glucose 4-epimerase
MTRDYCFVGDIVQANLQAIDKGSKGAFNIGTCKETHTADLFNEVFAALKNLRPELDDNLRKYETGAGRPGDLTRSCLIYDKAGDELGFNPDFTLDRGLAETAKWRVALS